MRDPDWYAITGARGGYMLCAEHALDRFGCVDTQLSVFATHFGGE